MNLHIQYITDNIGNKMSVVIPYKEWTQFEDNYKKLLNKLALLKSIKEGIYEVRNARKNGLQLESLEDFLNEC